jgi:hypothetical protein
MSLKSNVLSVVVVAAVAASASVGRASVNTIDWLNYTPHAVNVSGDTITNGEIFNLVGIGNVRVDYTNFSVATPYRANRASLIAGSVISGGDTYNWSDFEDFRRVNFNSEGTITQWSVTYTFLGGPVAAGNLYVGAWGLGRLDLNYSGNISVATVNQSGAFIGQYDGGDAALGAAQYTGGVGTFNLRNSIPGDTTPGNPAFNSALGIVRIDDAVSSLTFTVDHIGFDGLGVNIGTTLVPEPGAAAILALGGLIATRRRR